MRIILIALFTAILVSMLVITTLATMQRGVFEAGRELIADRWFQATLLDAYFGFITFFVWVAYKERKAWRRTLWFLSIMFLGNIAMAIYVLVQLLRLSPSQPVSSILVRSPA